MRISTIDLCRALGQVEGISPTLLTETPGKIRINTHLFYVDQISYILGNIWNQLNFIYVGNPGV
jgi:hypothetical protein